jgi:predicted O-methyltransferase YrrM
MQALQAGMSSGLLASTELSSATILRDRETLLIKSLEYAREKGIVAEFGVYKGYTLRLIADSLPRQEIYGFDSFEGLPENWRAGFDKGVFKVDSKSIAPFQDNVRLYSGLFDESIPIMLNEDARKMSFIHIDCDLYSSTKCIFDLISSRLQVGTVIVFDEYFNFPGWEHGEHLALLEAARNSCFSFDYLFYNALGQQVSIIVTSTR